jgi:PAS domain S-box-containing protein
MGDGLLDRPVGEMELDRRRPRPDNAIDYIKNMPATLLLDRLPAAVLAVDEDSVVVFVNHEFEDLLGCRRDEVVGNAADWLFADDTDERSVFVMLREQAHRVVELRHTDGSVVKVLMSGSVLVRDADPIAVVVVQDVTEQLWTLGQLASDREREMRGPTGPDSV